MGSFQQQIHATAVDVDGVGVVLRGPSGSGKSDLALRLIDGGARLVADDRTDLTVTEGRLWAAPPPALAGGLEVRGVGLLRLDYRAVIAVGLVVDLVAPAAVERLPDAATCAYGGCDLPLLRLAPFEASAPAKIRLMAARLGGAIGVFRAGEDRT
ncbi:MAG: HPr kinase/phosphatase C-terminal domain-containing protein [Rhodobacterales bacterium]|nr:HPr kinase/phosphatase C-terminal domain-containing protein [Rhodobacterales bacterium]